MREVIVSLIPAILAIIAFIASEEVRKFIRKHRVLTSFIVIFVCVMFYIPQKAIVHPPNPVSLESLEIVAYRDTYFNEGDCIDSSGRQYMGEYYILLASYSSEQRGVIDSAYVDFKANKKYTTITGKIAPHKNIGDAADSYGVYGSEWGINIFADNKLVYTSPVITKAMHPIFFTVDGLSDCNIIRIETYGDYYAHLLLLDPKVY